jgi:hypothetical protein
MAHALRPDPLCQFSCDIAGSVIVDASVANTTGSKKKLHNTEISLAVMAYNLKWIANVLGTVHVA